MWYTHGTSHYIGIDVHDVGERSRTLQTGMAFVDRAGHLHPAERARRAAADRRRTARSSTKIQPAVTKYADIGVRVEDSFLLEESGLRRLSAVGAADDRRNRSLHAQPACFRDRRGPIDCS